MPAIAVVTGASGGIGREIARTIHDRSGGELRLALHYHGNRAAAESLLAAIPGAFLVQAELSTAEGRRHLVESVLSAGVPYALVNNAGIDRPHEPALDLEESSFDRILNLNLKAPLFLMKAFGREMARAESGVIVNISSVLARKSLIGSAVYRATKAGLEALTRQFAFELGPRGVRVNAVAPGFIKTPMSEAMREEVKGSVRAEIALREIGTAESVATAVWHLIENEYASGAVLAIDGGLGL